jgi:hypothetical protein
MDRKAGHLAALVLAGRPDSSAAMLQELAQLEAERRRAGAPPSGLLDNARDLLHTLAGPSGYRAHAGPMLREQDLDPVLRRRLSSHLEADPLRVAERRLHEHRMARLSGIFNRISRPLASLGTAGVLNPIEAGRSAISTLLAITSSPEVSVQERQALRAYEEFLKRHPDSPEATEVAARVERYRLKRKRELHGRAVAAAEQALGSGSPEVCLAHLERAERILPGDAGARALRAEAEAKLEERRAQIASALSATEPLGLPADPQRRFEWSQLLAAALVAPPEEVAGRARAARDREWGARVPDELEFLELREVLERDGEDAFFRAAERIARLDPRESNMARHARSILADPDQNPYASYREARRSDRGGRLRFLALGQYHRGPPRYGLPRPLEWLLGAPGALAQIALTPLRLVQYPAVRARFGASVIDAGERYLRKFPDGEHARDVHRELEGLHAGRGRWAKALEHHRARGSPQPRTVARYRRNAAEQALEAARLERRWDVRIQLYRWVQQDYGDTPQAAVASRELADLLRETTPQNIRLSRAFLLENPELLGGAALALRPELLDGDGDNGELAEEGVTLLGQTDVRIALEGRPPAVETLPEKRFSRMVALIEEAYYRRLATDERERPEPDPQRDLFFEQARLGLLGKADTRPTASSDATFLSTVEKHGRWRRESLLPVELVVSGDLEGFGLSAYPRIRPPEETEDAWLYR